MAYRIGVKPGKAASVVGMVGAGGIGLHLSEQIRTLEWQRVAFIVLMILVVVFST